MNDKLIKGNFGVYIIHNGLTNYYKDFGNINPQLVGGLIDALTKMASSTYGVNTKFTFTRIEGDNSVIENLVTTNGDYNCLIILRDNCYLSDDAYKLLRTLSNDLITETKKLKEKFSLNGGAINNLFKNNLETIVNQQLLLLKEQIASTYLMSILSEAINYGVKRDKAEEWIKALSRNYELGVEYISKLNQSAFNSIKQLVNNDKKVKTLKKIIQRINKKYDSVWRLFNIKLLLFQE